MAAGNQGQEPTTPTRKTSQIEADVAATRHRIAANVESLIDDVHPNRIKQRQIDSLKAFANTELESARSLLFTARGDLRTGRVAVVAAAAAGAVTFLLVVRALVRRGRRD